MRWCDNLTVDNSNTTDYVGYYQEVIQIKCDSGYWFAESHFDIPATCRKDKTWSRTFMGHCKSEKTFDILHQSCVTDE